MLDGWEECPYTRIRSLSPVGPPLPPSYCNNELIVQEHKGCWDLSRVFIHVGMVSSIFHILCSWGYWLWLVINLTNEWMICPSHGSSSTPLSLLSSLQPFGTWGSVFGLGKKVIFFHHNPFPPLTQRATPRPLISMIGGSRGDGCLNDYVQSPCLGLQALEGYLVYKYMGGGGGL